MGRKLFVLLAVMILAASVPAECKTRGPSTPHERARALNYIQSLEQNPLAKDSLDKRMWLTEWIVRVPDITVARAARHSMRWTPSTIPTRTSYASRPFIPRPVTSCSIPG